MADAVINHTAAIEPLAALAPETVFTTLEALAPQARPYNFDDRFDCWGLVREVYGGLLAGRPLDDDLEAASAVETARLERWAPITELAELLPGDVVTTHDHHAPGEFHAVIVYGWLDGRLLVYDSSPRGDIPFVEERDGQRVVVDARELHTRHMRATGGTDRLRNDGGAYLRLWFVGGRCYNRRLHEALLEANPRRETDALALRRRAGLAALPFYVTHRLPTDRAGRELYDNRATRALNAYLPDGAPLRDDDYQRACDAGVIGDPSAAGDTLGGAGGAGGAGGGDGGDGPGGRLRPAPPVLETAPTAVHTGAAPCLTWSYQPAVGDLVATGCRVELYELRRGVWKHLVLARDCDEPERSFTVPADVLRADMCYEVSLFTRAAAGYSADTVATFVNEPAADNPFLVSAMVRPFALAPDEGAVVATVTPELSWSIFDPRAHQSAVRLAIHAGGCCDGEAPLIHEAILEGEAAAGTAYAVPAAAGLTPGTTYHWYLTPRDREGRWAYAPVEGIFTVAAAGLQPSSADASQAAATDASRGLVADPPPAVGGAPRRDPRRRPRAGGL